MQHLQKTGGAVVMVNQESDQGLLSWGVRRGGRLGISPPTRRRVSVLVDHGNEGALSELWSAVACGRFSSRSFQIPRPLANNPGQSEVM